MGAPANRSSVYLPAIHPCAHLSSHLSIYSFIHQLSIVCPSSCPSICCPSICPPFCPFAFHLFFLLSAHSPIHLSFLLSVIYQSTCLLSIHLSFLLSVHPPIYLSVVHSFVLPPPCLSDCWLGCRQGVERGGSVSTAGRAHAICSLGFMPSRLAPHDLCETLEVHVGRPGGRCSPGSGT